MKIIKLEASNFMGIRQVNFNPREQGLTQITGKNGQGKSTLVKFIEWMLAGPTAIPMKQKRTVVRHGSKTAWGKITLNDPEMGTFTVTRSLTVAGTMNLDIFDAEGVRVKNQQGWLNDLVTGLSFDPLEFARMDTEEQIAELKRLSIVDLDFAAHATADKMDEEERRALGKELKALDVRIGQIDKDALVAGITTTKIDEKQIFAKLSAASETNRKARELNREKESRRQFAAELERQRGRHVDQAEQIRQRIDRLKQDLELAEQNIVAAATAVEAAEADFQAAPFGEEVDVNAISQELQKAQRTNVLIDMHAQWEALTNERGEKERLFQGAQDRLDMRDEQRKDALKNAKLPVKNLTFDSEQVYFDNLPLASLGEGEQIRISTLLGIHMNPKLKAMCIQHGEALDEDGLKVIEKLAIDHDFQIVMARVETSGTIGIVVENGMIAKINEGR